MEKEFICICGKELASQKGLSGHQGNCKEWYLHRDGNLDKFNLKNKKAKENQIKNLIKNNKYIPKKKENYLKEGHNCENCGSIITEWYGSGRFCSAKCARSFSTKKNRKEINAKVSKTMRGTKIYSNKDGKVLFLRDDDLIPDGFVRGNFTAVKNGQSFEEFKNRSLNKNKKIRKNKNKYRELLLAVHKPTIEEHNNEILNTYINVLKNKAENKSFYIDESLIVDYAGYKAVLDKNHPRSTAGRVFIHILLAGITIR